MSSASAREVNRAAPSRAAVQMAKLPGSEKRTWFFLGLASYEGIIRGAIRPGGIATFVQDDDPVIERGAAPQVVREFLLTMARHQERRPMARGADGKIDWAGVLRAVLPDLGSIAEDAPDLRGLRC